MDKVAPSMQATWLFKTPLTLGRLIKVQSGKGGQSEQSTFQSFALTIPFDP